MAQAHIISGGQVEYLNMKAQFLPDHRWHTGLPVDEATRNLCFSFGVDEAAFYAWLAAHPQLKDGHNAVNYLRALRHKKPFPRGRLRR